MDAWRGEQMGGMYLQQHLDSQILTGTSRNSYPWKVLEICLVPTTPLMKLQKRCPIQTNVTRTRSPGW